MNWRNLFESPAKPSVGLDKRIFAIGDIHGRSDLLNTLLGEIIDHVERTAPVADNSLVFLGDYIDRGPDSRAVIERLARLQKDLKGWKTVFLRGNHDQSLLDFVNDPNVYRTWRSYGAAQTLVSYGVMPPRFDDEGDFIRARDEFVRLCPPGHLAFIRGLAHSHVEGDYVFVHAGLRPGVPLAEQTPQDLMWIRDEFLLHRRKFEKIVVHGHTPSPSPITLANRICIDTGAHATGNLTALVLEQDRHLFLKAVNKKRPVDAVTRLAAVNS